MTTLHGPHYRSRTAWAVLLVLAVAQMATLTAPLALAIGQRPELVWREVIQQLAGGTAPWAAIAAIAGAVVLGTPAGMALWRARAGGLWAGVLMAPALLPITLVAQVPRMLDDTPQVGLMLATHGGMGLGFGAAFTWLALRPVDGGMLRAAATCGWSPAGVFVRLMVPLALRGVAAGAFLAALVSLSTSMGQLLSGTGAPLVTVLSLPKLLIWGAAGGVLLTCVAVGGALNLLKRP